MMQNIFYSKTYEILLHPKNKSHVSAKEELRNKHESFQISLKSALYDYHNPWKISKQPANPENQPTATTFFYALKTWVWLAGALYQSNLRKQQG